MDNRVSEGDIIQHVVKIGIDTLPPISRSNMLTRLNSFAEEARVRWPNMYKNFTSGDSFSITHAFHSASDPTKIVTGPSFVLTDRGPVFMYPLVIPDLDKTNIADGWLASFREAFDFFFKKFAELKIVRLGIIRELIFDTGSASCIDILRADDCFAGGGLKGGETRLDYHTEDYNIIVYLSTAEITRSITLPVGQKVDKGGAHGLVAKLDVNNRVLRELEGTDVEGILETANSLWPKNMLDYINQRYSS